MFLQEHFPQPRAERQSGAIRDSEAQIQYGSCEQTPKDPKRLQKCPEWWGTRLEYRAAGMTTKVKSGRRSVTSPDTKGRPRGLGYIGQSWHRFGVEKHVCVINKRSEKERTEAFALTVC